MLEKIRRRLVPLVREGVIEDPVILTGTCPEAGARHATIRITPALTARAPAGVIVEAVRRAISDLDGEFAVELVAG